MKYTHNRRSIRLPGYDYSQSGDYFITICTYQRKCLFGTLKNNKIILNNFGKIVKNEWQKASIIRKNFHLDKFIIMPNHIHGIITITDPVRTNSRSPQHSAPCINSKTPYHHMQPKSVSSFMAGFKSTVTKQINQLRKTPHQPIWQRNYYEHIIQTEKSLYNIREYIENNPSNWNNDRNNLSL